LSGIQVRLIAFAIGQDGVDRRIVVVEEINRPKTAALAGTGSFPTDFANAAGFPDEIPGERIACQEVYKLAPFRFVHTGSFRRSDESR